GVRQAAREKAGGGVHRRADGTARQENGPRWCHHQRRQWHRQGKDRRAEGGRHRGGGKPRRPGGDDAAGDAGTSLIADPDRPARPTCPPMNRSHEPEPAPLTAAELLTATGTLLVLITLVLLTADRHVLFSRKLTLDEIFTHRLVVDPDLGHALDA